MKDIYFQRTETVNLPLIFFFYSRTIESSLTFLGFTAIILGPPEMLVRTFVGH